MTDAEGVYLIPIDEPGAYVVRIDVETLPEGLAVEEGKEEQTAEVGGNQNVTRAFFLGEDSRREEQMESAARRRSPTA